MNALRIIHDAGVKVNFEPGGKLRLKGLSGLSDEGKSELISFVKKNKRSIITALTARLKLPSTCPFETGGHCPPGCRFTTKFLVRMIEGGTLPDPVIGCPLRHVCGETPDYP